MTTIQSIRESVGKNIKKLRAEANLTQEQLAEKLEVSNSHLANIERGKTGMSDDVLCGLCNVFDKKPSEIYSSIDMNFEFDKRMVFAVNDSISETLKEFSSVLSEKISKRISSKIDSGEYIARRNERVPLKKVAASKKK